MKYITFDDNIPAAAGCYSLFVCLEDDGKTPVEETDHNRHELIKRILADGIQLDHYIQCGPVVYRLCRSSKQATKVTGESAKLIRRIIKSTIEKRAEKGLS